MPMGNLNAALTRLGVTQGQLAEVLGLSQPAVHRKLHGLREFTRAEINATLAFLRERDPEITYEQLFSPTAAVA